MNLTAKTLDGRLLTLPPPIRLSYNADRDIPCDDLDVTLPLTGQEEFCEVALAREGTPLLEGIVDRQISENSGEGRTLRLECRSKTALLLDNEVKPYIYFQLTSGQLFERFAAPCGVLGARFPFEGKKNFLTVKKGSSHWKVIEDFCLQVYQKQPYMPPAPGMPCMTPPSPFQ